MSRTTIVLFLAILCFAPSFALTAPIPTGVISAINGSAENVTVLHLGKIYTPEEGFLIYEGDHVDINAQETTVQISPFDGSSPIQIAKNNAATVGIIKASKEPPTLMNNLLGWLSKRLPPQKKSKTASLAIRKDDELLLSSMRPGDQMLVMGRRDLLVAWRGDTGPYDVRLFREEGGKFSIVKQQSGLKNKEITLAGLTLSTGKYRIEIVAMNQRTDCYLNVVPESELPEEPDEIVSSGLPSSIQALLYIAWLQEREGWRFEAMQLAAKVSKDNPGAIKILSAMKDGQGEFLY